MRTPARTSEALRTMLALIIILALTPVVSAMIAIDAAAMLGCRIDPGMSVPCPVGLVDLGATLYAAAMAGWFAFATAPAAMLLAVVWLAVALAFVARQGFARKGYAGV